MQDTTKNNVDSSKAKKVYDYDKHPLYFRNFVSNTINVHGVWNAIYVVKSNVTNEFSNWAKIYESTSLSNKVKKETAWEVSKEKINDFLDVYFPIYPTTKLDEANSVLYNETQETVSDEYDGLVKNKKSEVVASKNDELISSKGEDVDDNLPIEEDTTNTDIAKNETQFIPIDANLPAVDEEQNIISKPIKNDAIENTSKLKQDEVDYVTGAISKKSCSSYKVEPTEPFDIEISYDASNWKFNAVDVHPQDLIISYDEPIINNPVQPVLSQEEPESIQVSFNKPVYPIFTKPVAIEMDDLDLTDIEESRLVQKEVQAPVQQETIKYVPIEINKPFVLQDVKTNAQDSDLEKQTKEEQKAVIPEAISFGNFGQKKQVTRKQSEAEGMELNTSPIYIAKKRRMKYIDIYNGNKPLSSENMLEKYDLQQENLGLIKKSKVPVAKKKR